MKKTILFAILFAASTFTFAQSFLGGCYTIDARGHVSVSLTSPNSLPSGTTVFIDDGSGPSLCTLSTIASNPTLDDDGVHYDYLYTTGVTITMADLTGRINQMPCYRIYYDVSGNTGFQESDPSFTICRCSPVSSSCYTLRDGKYYLKIVYNNFYYQTIRDEIGLVSVTPGLFAANGSSLNTGVDYGQDSPDSGDPGEWIADGSHWDVNYIIPAEDITPDPVTGCLTIFYNLLAIPVGGEDPVFNGNINTWASMESTVICPCCTSNSVSLSVSENTTSPGFNETFTAHMVSDWDFGDGNTGNGTIVHHTYTLPGTYTACARSTSADGTICRKCQTFCLADPNISGHSGGVPGGGCNADFTVSISDATLSLGTGFSYSVGSGTCYFYDFGDGTTASNPDGFIQHTYACPGTYRVCVSVGACGTGGFSMCMICEDVCIAEGSVFCPPSGRHASSVSKVPLSERISIAPNPANNIADIDFDLNKETNVQITVIDPIGRVVNDFTRNNLTQGHQKVEINTSDLSPGIYNVRIKANDEIVTKRLSIMK